MFDALWWLFLCAPALFVAAVFLLVLAVGRYRRAEQAGVAKDATITRLNAERDQALAAANQHYGNYCAGRREMLGLDIEARVS